MDNLSSLNSAPYSGMKDDLILLHILMYGARSYSQAVKIWRNNSRCELRYVPQYLRVPP